MTFYVGQKVVCVDVGYSETTGHPARSLKIGVVYTVAWTYTSRRGNPGVILAEVKPASDRARGFLASRFRPVVERKTDISVFKAMLNPAPDLVDAQ